MKKLLILGISGLTGYKIARIAGLEYDVFGTYNFRKVELDGCNIIKLDVTNSSALNELFSKLKPDFVINATALHNVDYCEENNEEAFSINTKTIQTLLNASKIHDSKIVHISTDYVFDGTKNIPYKETDLPSPLNYYGKSKLDGEKILENHDHVIVRPSVVYGWTPLELAGTSSSSGKPMNFALWMLNKLAKNEALKIVDDQFASATLADSLAESMLEILKKKKTGLYHVSGLSCESRYEFATKIARKFGYDQSLITPVKSSEFIQKAKRPQYSCLDCTKSKEIGLPLLTTEESLDIMKNQIEKEAPHLIRKN